MKRIAVFGANGRGGSLVVLNLLAQGYEITALVHRKKSLKESKQLRIIEGDIHDSVAVAAALEGADAVVSALGSWGTPTKDILESGMRFIIPEMKRRGIGRIVSLTGSEARARGDTLSLIHRIAHMGATLAAGPILRDGEAHIKLLENSGLEWTVLRSPVMNEKGSDTFRFTLQRPLPWQTINRHAVATAVVAQLKDYSYARKAPFISR